MPSPSTILPSTAAPCFHCTSASHAALRASPLWKLLRLDGYQRTAADEFGPAECLEVRTCACGSTLSIAIDEAVTVVQGAA